MDLSESPILKTRGALQPNDLLRNYALFLVLHVLDDLEPLVEACIDLGADPSLISTVGIPYSSRRDAGAAVARHGVKVHLPPIFPFDAPLVEWLREDLEAARRAGKRLIIVEDGGYAVPLLSQLVAVDRLDPKLVAGGVEQTTRGMRLDRQLAESGLLPWPVVSIPGCGSKQTIEPMYIARAVLRNLLELLRHLERDEPASVGIFGAGAIGMHVAEAFKDSGADVYVADTAADRQYAAYARHRFNRLERDRVKDCRLLLGTSGFTSIDADILDEASNDTIVASASSRQIEIDTQWLYGKAIGAPVPFDPVGRCVMQIPAGRQFGYAVPGASKRVTVLYDGYPINFWGASLPEHVGDAVMALLLEGIIAVASGNLHQSGVLDGSIILAEADLAISDFWRETKPDDGISPLGG
jgi:S-adenosylhomocysteine hydrolase